MINAKNYVFRQVAKEAVVDLRHQELRQGFPRSEAIFDGDELPTTFHFAAYEKNAEHGSPLETPVCVVTYQKSELQGEPAYQLRGMATTRLLQGKGIGRLLVARAEEIITKQTGIYLFWCNARTSAIKFYRTMGWLVVSDEFEIPGAGPHVKMMCALK